MKPSIRRQFAGIFIGLMTGVILLCWLANSVFLEKYYLYSKKKVLYSAYESIRQAATSDSYGAESFVLELNNICNSNNITICVLDSDSQTKYTSVNGGEKLEIRLLGYIFGFEDIERVLVLEDAPEYRLQRSGNIGEEYLEMLGRLSSGISFVMRTPIESIRESAAVANRFFFYVGLTASIAGGVIIWAVARKITGPILKLNAISEQMVNLHFEAKYTGRAHNEIDMLGENINKLSESLEKSISELKTANNELKKDIEKKEQIDEMRKEFLANVSHELKTPLALIQGYAEGLREGISEDAQSREFYCDVIVDEASKMNSMVQKLLTLNELEFGNDIVNLERFDITAMLRECLAGAEILLRQNEISVKMEPYQPVYVWADAFKTEEVFRNYLSNAMHHCERQKYIEVKLLIKQQKVRVCVFNCGTPIPEQSLPYIWDKFYKVDKARTREYGGSGVGLSIVKAIMESMNQAYGVENFTDGVMFWFELETVQEG